MKTQKNTSSADNSELYIDLNKNPFSINIYIIYEPKI